MKNKKFLCLVLLLSFLLLSGCETTKGAAKGTGNTLTAMIKGAGDDSFHLMKFIMAIDSWMQRNLW